MFYTCATAEQEYWFSKAREKGGWKISIKYTPQDTSFIYWANRFGIYEKCPRTNDSASLYPGLTMEEIDFEIDKMQSQQKSAHGRQLQNAIDYDNNISSILEEAHAQKNKLPMGKRKNNTKEIKKNRKKEAEAIRKDQQTSQPQPPADAKADIIDFRPAKAYNYDNIFAQFREEDDK